MMRFNQVMQSSSILLAMDMRLRDPIASVLCHFSVPTTSNVKTLEARGSLSRSFDNGSGHSPPNAEITLYVANYVLCSHRSTTHLIQDTRCSYWIVVIRLARI